jgi:hypothetical protein
VALAEDAARRAVAARLVYQMMLERVRFAALQWPVIQPVPEMTNVLERSKMAVLSALLDLVKNLRLATSHVPVVHIVQTPKMDVLNVHRI